MNDLILRAYAHLQTRDKGVTAIEYGLIAALIAVVIIVAVTAVGTQLNGVFNLIQQKLDGVTP